MTEKIKSIYNSKLNKKLQGLKSGNKKADYNIIALKHKQVIAEMVDKELRPMIRAIIDKALTGDVQAFECLINRYAGKPAQELELKGTQQTIVFMPQELLQRHTLPVNSTIDGNKDVLRIEKPLT
jgi:hypothetical protein